MEQTQPLGDPAPRNRTARMRRFYETSDAYFDLLAESSSAAHERELDLYVRLMQRHAPGDRPVLDLGCGRGISTGKLATGERFIVGADLSFRLLHDRDRQAGRAGWAVASADRLPFHDGAFALIGMNSVLEHVADVPQVLAELCRLVERGGRVLILSPNLLSPLHPLKSLLGRDMVSRDFYGTRLRAFLAIFGNVLRLVGKRLSRRARFRYREPQLEHFAGPDDDAAYFCTSVDLLRWFHTHGMHARRVPLPLDGGGVLTRLKRRVAFLLPDVDKGFCVLAEKP